LTVKAIRLENFMAFEDTGWIELRPITLLFGRNSSGKSVVIRALRLLKQSLDCYPKFLNFLTETGVDLPEFPEALHREAHLAEGEQRMGFHFRCELNNTLEELKRIVNQQRGRRGQPPIDPEDSRKWAELRLFYAWNSDAKWEELVEFEIRCPWSIFDGSDERTIFFAERLDEEAAALVGDDWWFDTDYLQGHEADEETLWSLVSVERTSGFLPNLALRETTSFTQGRVMDDFEFVASLLDEIRESIERFLRNIQYIGPVRPSPQRYYPLNRLSQLQWEQQGWSVLLSFLLEKGNEEQYREIDQWMQRLDLGCEVAPTRIDYKGSVIGSETLIHESPEGIWVNIMDVGFGASQVLPIIVQAVMAEPEQLVIIEQPELHLHPGAQSELTDLFIDRVYRLVEDEQEPEGFRREESGVRFLLETHSEHILLRLRRRIAESSAGRISLIDREYLPQKSLRVFFIGRDPPSSSVEQVQISRLGEMSSPPGFEGFFSDDLRETAKLARARLESRLITGDADDPGH